VRRRVRAIGLGAVLAIVLAACGAAVDDGQPAADPGADAEAPDTGVDDAEAEDAPEAGGEPAPDVEFEDFDGATRTLADFRGQPLVLNFWASWCPPCIAEMPYIESVHQDLADRVGFLGMNTQDAMGPALDLVEQTGVTYELGLDPQGDIFRAFSVFTMPMTFFINAEGEIVGRHGGILTEQQLRDEIESTLGVS
jgi:thiol-disulfide isomerase/thioredoxin